MKLETLTLTDRDNNPIGFRVSIPGGWIYIIHSATDQYTACFVRDMMPPDEALERYADRMEKALHSR